MDRRDYIMRMIEQFGRFALALRKLILGGQAGSAEVKDQLRSVAQHAGLDLDIARAATADTLALFIAPTGEIEPARCWMCAETLYLDGLDAQLSDDPDRAFASFSKARMLFKTVAPMGAFVVGFPEAAERIAEIDRKLAELGGQDSDLRDGPRSDDDDREGYGGAHGKAHARRLRPRGRARGPSKVWRS